MVSQNACLHLAHVSPSTGFLDLKGLVLVYLKILMSAVVFLFVYIFTISYTLSKIGFPLFFPFHF